MALILRRIRGAAQGPAAGGLHGTGIVSVKVLPGGQTLSETKETKVPVGLSLGFGVTVEDTGDSQEVQIQVTLTIQQSAVADRPDEDDRPDQPGRARRRSSSATSRTRRWASWSTVKVDVAPVPGEKNTANNSAEYPVIFSLP